MIPRVPLTRAQWRQVALMIPTAIGVTALIWLTLFAVTGIMDESLECLRAVTQCARSTWQSISDLASYFLSYN